MKGGIYDITQMLFIFFLFIILFISFVIIFLKAYTRRHLQYINEKKLLEEKFHSELLQSQLEIQEQTFNHISQEIHDNVGQVLSLAKVQANIIKESNNTDLLEDVKDNISKALTDLRDIAKSLNSERLKTLNISEAAKLEIERINKTGFISASITSSGEERKLIDRKKLILFRIIQECLQNIIKHAYATEIKLIFLFYAEFLVVQIIDNGRGFDVDKMTSERSGLGLQNIETRASLIGGTIKIESTQGLGSNVTIMIPYE